jgi:hypothetical protein
MIFQMIVHEAFRMVWQDRSNDAELQRLFARLQAAPDLGDSIPTCGMLRKLRAPDPSRRVGAQGGLRIVYMVNHEARRIRLLMVYGKDERDDLTPRELASLCSAARALRESDNQWAKEQRKGKR